MFMVTFQVFFLWCCCSFFTWLHFAKVELRRRRRSIYCTSTNSSYIAHLHDDSYNLTMSLHQPKSVVVANAQSAVSSVTITSSAKSLMPFAHCSALVSTGRLLNVVVTGVHFYKAIGSDNNKNVMSNCFLAAVRWAFTFAVFIASF